MFGWRKKTHFFLLEHHEVEMPYPLSSIRCHAFTESLLSNDLAYVFVYQAPAVMSARSMHGWSEEWKVFVD